MADKSKIEWTDATWNPIRGCSRVSVEDQKTAEQRITPLLHTPAAVRWLSIEPLLGPVDLIEAFPALGCSQDAASLADIHWVVVGGESGPRARPMHPDWARTLRDQCVAAGVPFFFKQFGDYRPRKAGREFKPEEVDRFVADLVVCALRMANTCPGRTIDLQRAVEERIETKNQAELRREPQ